MANTKINELPLFTGNTSGATFIMNDSTETNTYKVTKEKINEGLISGSSQINYSGLTGIPSGIISGSSQILDGSGIWSGSVQLPSDLVSGSSQVIYSGITGIPSGIVSGSSQITNLGFATTGSQTLIGNQTVNGNLVVTGSITANSYIISSSVYYVTESSVSGSSNFGNSLDDTHNFTGSVNITGSLNVVGPIGARLYQLSDVNDNITGSVDGYLLTYNSGSNNWYANPGAGLKGNVRIYVATTKTNHNPFYFNANTRTASDSANLGSDTAFMVTSNLLTRVTVYLRQDAPGPNSTVVSIYKNANGTAFSSASQLATTTLSLIQDTVQTFQFSGLTLNVFDSIHIYCDPGATPGTIYGIVVIE